MKTFTIKLKKLLVPLVVQCMLMVGFVATGYGQAAELPILGYGGPWDPNNLPIGWTGNLDWGDFEDNLGSSATGGAAGFYAGAPDPNIVIHFDVNPGDLTYWLAFQYEESFLGNEFHVLESPDGVNYTLARNHTDIPIYDAIAKGAQYSVALKRDSRYVKFSYAINEEAGSASVMLDDISLGAAVEGPEINIKQNNSGITSGGSFIFGTVGVNSTNLKTFIIENLGTDPLLLSGAPKIVLSGTNASEFKIDEAATLATVNGGEFTTFEVSFKPTTFGAKSATLSIANNDADENPYIILLTGSAQEFPPAIISTNPTSGKVGAPVTITGEYLSATTTVTFGGVLASFTLVSDTQIDAVVPQGAKTGPIRVTTSGGQFAESATFTVTSPFITEITPTQGTYDDVITIKGANFRVPATVRFTGANGTLVSASVTSLSTTEIKAKVPLNAITGPIHVTTNSETVQSNVFTVTPPIITALDKTSGKIGYLVKITGTGFDVSSTVTFNGTPVPAGDILFTNSKELTVKIPIGATTGPIAVTTAGRTGQSQEFTVIIPTITVTGTLVAFETKLGTSSVAQSFQVSGVDLDGNISISAPEHFQISLDPNSASYGSAVTLTAINGSVSATPVYVKYNPSVRGIHSGNITSTSLNAAPRTIAVNGNSEATLTLSGNNFSNFEAVVGATSAAKQYIVRGKNIVTNVVITVPAEFQISGNGFTWSTSASLSPSAVEGADKTVLIRYRPTSAGNHGGNVVHTTEGTTASFAITGTAESALAIESLSSTSGIVGSTVQINGYRLNQGGTPTVTFGGGVAATVESASATAVTVTVPEGAQTGAISLTTTEGTVSSQSFTVLSNLVVTGTLEPFTTEMAQPSAVQSYTIAGTSLAEAVTVTAPFNFQVSLSGSTGFGTSVQVEPVAGSIASTPIYVRYYPITVTSDAGDITNASAGAQTMNVAVQGESTPIEGGAMPVEFVSFTHVQQKDGVMLDWKTATEKNNSHFEVEIAYDLTKGFERIGRVESKVINSSVLTKYQYKHSFTTGGTRYYRLKQVDLDGTFAYSNVIAVETQAAEAVALVSVAPNPLNYNSKVFITALADGNAVLRLSSMEGKQVYTKEAAVRKGENEVQLPVYDKLSKGVYMLTVELNGTVHKVKVLKQ